jgi:tetratricopeptide (TPR) repeat protein
MLKTVKEAITRAAVMKAALSELKRFSSYLEAELPDPARTSGREAEDETTAGRPHVYVSDEPLHSECADEVKLLILGIRHLARQQRYEEALSLAREATRLAPSYWRAWVTLGTLLALFGKVEEAEKIFRRVVTDFAGDPKAVAAGLHCHAWINEIRFGDRPPGDVPQETTRLYEAALRLDNSRTNPRACLAISRLMSEGGGGHEQELEDSVLHEGFLENLRFELDKRGARIQEVLKAIPTWLRHLLYPIRPLNVSDYSR